MMIPTECHLTSATALLGEPAESFIIDQGLIVGVGGSARGSSTMTMAMTDEGVYCIVLPCPVPSLSRCIGWLLAVWLCASLFGIFTAKYCLL